MSGLITLTATRPSYQRVWVVPILEHAAHAHKTALHVRVLGLCRSGKHWNHYERRHVVVYLDRLKPILISVFSFRRFVL